jgi:tetratricopeptide (TPR) repeat protein
MADLTHLENQLRTAPGILDCGAVEGRDAAGNETRTVFLVVGRDFDREVLRQYCLKAVDAVFLPFQMAVLTAIPRSASGAVDRTALAQLAALPAAPDRAAILQGAMEADRAMRFDEAIALFREAYALQPDNYNPLRDVGRILLLQGRAVEARAVLEVVARKLPRAPDVLVNLGVATMDSGDIAGALPNFQMAIVADPGFAPAHFNLGRALIALQRPDEAIPALAEAARLQPQKAENISMLATAYASAKRLSEAAESFQRSLALSPDHPIANHNLGVVLQELNRPSEAIPYFERAIAREPNYADAHRGIGLALDTMGRRKEAVRHLEDAARIRPGSGLYLRDIAQLAPEDDRPIAERRLDDAISDSRMPAHERVHLLAGKSYLRDRVGDHDGAFRHASEANALARSLFSYDESDELAIFDRVAEASRRMGSVASTAAHGNSPIFIVGMPRSGTTLVEQILASHPDVFGAGETDHLGESLLALGLGPFSGPQFMDGLPSLDPRRFATAGKDYLARTNALGSKPRVVSKTLANYLRLDLLRRMLPDARIILVVRDPRDTCVSRFMSVFFPGNPYAHELGELGRYHRRYERLMEFWRDAFPANAFLDVSYERLVADPEAEIRKILDYCNLAWDQKCLRFYETPRVISTPTRNEVRQPISSAPVGRWRRYERHLGPLLAALQSTPQNS